MSTIVCQSMVPSSFESQLAEATTLKLKVAAPPAAFDVIKKRGTDMDRSENLEFGNWGFLQTVPRETGEYFRDNNYANPWAKKSSFSTLSAKSLELCTENLGSETGSDIVSDGGGDDIFSFSSPPPPVVEHSSFHNKALIDTNCRRHSNPSKTPYRREAKSFPPPLTTMTGANSLQVLRHREGGRLIIEAVEAPFRNAYLQAERSDGRLRLSYMTAEATTSGAGEDSEDEFGDEKAAEVENDEKGQIEEAGSEVGSELDEEFESDGEISSNLEKEFEIHQWLRRCKEEGGRGNKGLCTNWKPALWVAIS